MKNIKQVIDLHTKIVRNIYLNIHFIMINIRIYAIKSILIVLNIQYNIDYININVQNTRNSVY